MYLLVIHFFITISFLVFLSYFTSSLFLLLYQVNSLMCYQCESYSSPADCASKEIQTTCVGGSVRCATVEAKYESDSISSLVIVKGCAPTAACDGEIDICGQGEGMECDIQCCSGDLCNGDYVEGSVVKDSFCHTCVSNSSMADCIESQTQEQCSLKENRCGVMFAHQGEISLFRKGCIPDDFCSSLCQNGHIEGDPSIECELYCCEGSLCNDENMGAK